MHLFLHLLFLQLKLGDLLKQYVMANLSFGLHCVEKQGTAFLLELGLFIVIGESEAGFKVMLI